MWTKLMWYEVNDLAYFCTYIMKTHSKILGGTTEQAALGPSTSGTMTKPIPCHESAILRNFRAKGPMSPFLPLTPNQTIDAPVQHNNNKSVA